MGKRLTLETVFTAVDRFTGPAKAMQSKMRAFNTRLQASFGKPSAAMASIDRALLAGAAIATGAAVTLGKSFSDAGAEAEKYKAVLKTMLGSQDAANKRFSEMSAFAASTPFELSDVVQLGNQLQALGKYSTETMTTLGDLAAASGKPIDQVSGAFAKLASGQKGVAVDMFRDLLITTKDWSKATGKGVSKSGEMLATYEEMLAALPQILKDKGFAGMMAEQSKTFGGITSNFQDSITRLKMAIGGPLNESLKKIIPTLQKMVEKWTAWVDANKALLEQRFDEFIRGIGEALTFLKKNWDNGTIKTIATMVATLWTLHKVLSAISLLTKTNPYFVALGGILLAANTMASLPSAAQRGAGMVTPAGPQQSDPRIVSNAIPGRTPMAPISTISSQYSESRQTVGFDFSGLPPGATAKVSGKAPPITLPRGNTMSAISGGSH